MNFTLHPNFTVEYLDLQVLKKLEELFPVDMKRKMHSVQEGLWVCFQDKCEMKPKSFLNNDLLSKHQSTQNNLPLRKCPKHFGAKRNMMKHMATKHREDTGVILTCRAWMLEICWQFHEQLIHYQLIQLTTLKLTTVQLTCYLMAEMTDSRQCFNGKKVL